MSFKIKQSQTPAVSSQSSNRLNGSYDEKMAMNQSNEYILGTIEPGIGSNQSLVFTTHRLLVFKSRSAIASAGASMTILALGWFLIGILPGTIMALVAYFIVDRLVKPKNFSNISLESIFRMNPSLTLSYSAIVSCELKSSNIKIIYNNGQVLKTKRLAIKGGKNTEANKQLAVKALQSKVVVK